jgi:hypothetical protein
MKTSLLSLLFILLLSSCSHIQPNVESVNERSVASERCDELVALFFNKNLVALEVPSTSLLGKNKDLIQRMDGIRLSSIDYGQYYQDFFALNKRAPTLRDALTYIEGIKRKTINNYDLLISDLQNLPNSKSPEVQLFIQEVSKVKSKVSQGKSIKQYDLELIASYEKGKTTIPNLDTIIPIDDDVTGTQVDQVFFQYLRVVDTLSDFQGGYGELMGMATSKEKVLMRGMRFDKAGSNNPLTERTIAEKVNALEVKVNKMTNEEIIELINPHKEGLFREAYRFLEENHFSMDQRQIVISKIFKMIRSKEIDLITENNQGLVTWVEVKAYNKPINMRLLNHGTKSILDQLIEHKALRDVLGLEASVKLRFVSSISVINDDAVKVIEGIGYEVISAK